MNKKTLFTFGLVIILFLFFTLSGCVQPVGKVGEAFEGTDASAQTLTKVNGPDKPLGQYEPNLGDKFQLSEPVTKAQLVAPIVFQPTEQKKTITVTAKDEYVFKTIRLCKTPCNNQQNWKDLTDFDGTPVSGNYLSGKNGLTKEITLENADLSEGNNFIVIYTCQGRGLCNNNKWLLQKFSATFPIPASCTDGVKNDPETDVDCGGTCPVKCPDTKVCNVPGDCASGVCGSDKKCAVPTCTDTIKNGAETDIDCGGTCPVKCPETKSCTIDADCATNKCDPSTKKCISSTVECASDNDCGLNVQCQCAKKTSTSGTCGSQLGVNDACICESQTKKCLGVKSGAFDISIVSTAAGFSPPSLTVLKGTRVTWKNNDAAAPHTVTHNVASPSFDSGILNPQQIYRNTFNTVGTFPYKCNFHPSMQGEVKVVEGIPPSTQPTITITSPTEGATVTSAVVPIQFTTANAVGKKIKLFVDGTAQSTLVDAGASGTINTPSLSNALHKVELEVVDTNGVSLSPTVKSGERSFTVTVQALPDFQVGVISFDSPSGGNQITIRIKYKNLGTRDYDGRTGNPIKLKYAVKNKDTNAVLPNGEGTHSLPVSLFTGDSEQKEDPITVSLGSLFKIKVDVTLDPSNEIPESIETNNEGTNSLDLTLGDPPPPGG